MDQGSDNWFSTFEQGDALLDGGMYRKAISKFEAALTARQKIGDDKESVVAIHRRIIACHGRLEEVSGPHAGLLTKADDFCSFISIRRFCVAVTSWSL